MNDHDEDKIGDALNNPQPEPPDDIYDDPDLVLSKAEAAMRYPAYDKPARLIVHVDAPQGTPVTHKRTGPTIEDATGVTVFLAAGTDSAPEGAGLAIAVINGPSGSFINIVVSGDVERILHSTPHGAAVFHVVPTPRQRPDGPVSDDHEVAPVGKRAGVPLCATCDKPIRHPEGSKYVWVHV